MKSTDAVDYRHNTKTKGTIFNVISFDGDVQDSFFPNVHAPFYFSLCISVNSFFALFPIFIFFFFLSSGAAIGKTMAVCTIIISFEGGKKCEGMSVVSGPNVYIIIYMGKKWNDDDEHSPAWLRAIYRDICLPFFHALMYIVFILFDEKKKFDFSFLL